MFKKFFCSFCGKENNVNLEESKAVIRNREVYLQKGRYLYCYINDHYLGRFIPIGDLEIGESAYYHDWLLEDMKKNLKSGDLTQLLLVLDDFAGSCNVRITRQKDGFYVTYKEYTTKL